MKIGYTVVLSMIAGITIGIIVSQPLYARVKPPVYLIAQNEVTNPDAYLKEFSMPTRASVKAAGGRYLVVGGNITPLDGPPPNSRIVIQVWDSMEKLKAWYSSPEFEPIRKAGMNYATFHTFAVEGVADE
jgi:uncharacterized protein (DUF1330 family)